MYGQKTVQQVSMHTHQTVSSVAADTAQICEIKLVCLAVCLSTQDRTVAYQALTAMESFPESRDSMLAGCVMQHSSDDMIYLHDPTALPHLILECDEQAPACDIKSAYVRLGVRVRTTAVMQAAIQAAGPGDAALV